MVKGIILTVGVALFIWNMLPTEKGTEDLRRKISAWSYLVVLVAMLCCVMLERH